MQAQNIYTEHVILHEQAAARLNPTSSLIYMYKYTICKFIN